MAQPSLLSDDLVQQLIAVGQVDVLVGIPTHNHAATIGPVVTAVHRAFARHFPRDRTVLVNADSGSTDGTREIVRDLSIDDADTVTMSHRLRTSHRIVTPYHGVPGKGGALRQIFAAADLLQARAVAVLDPDVTSVTAEWLQALLAPVRAHGCDFVAPVYARHPLEAPLVSQVVRPLMRAAYGRRLAEPQAPEFACSGAFAADCLARPVWETPLAQVGIDLWLTGTALSGPYRCGEVALGPRAVSAATARPGLAETFTQVVGSLFACLDLQADAWLGRQGSEPLPLIGAPPPPPPSPPAIDAERLLQSFGSDVKDLDSVLRTILEAETQSALAAASGAPLATLHVPDDLWAATVYQFLAAHHAGVMRREHITQALLPLYLGRAGAFVLAHAQDDAATIEMALESLCVAFERAKPYLVERWTGSSPR